ncbi:MAG: hypothetical protein HRT61_23655 [Ekhidna sp.]|nr:hypothetical protein [Ekhidna sp.]
MLKLEHRVEEHHEMLRDWLIELQHCGVKDSFLKKESGITTAISSLDRFRNRKPLFFGSAENFHKLADFIIERYPLLVRSIHFTGRTGTTTDYFFAEACQFFNVRPDRIGRIGKQFHDKYQIYTRSNYFYDSEAISVSDLEVDVQPDQPTRKVKNAIRYEKSNEKFGLVDLKDDFKGVIIPKSRRYMIIMRNKLGHPRIYFVDHASIADDDGKIDYFYGTMLKQPTNEQGIYFSVRFFARSIAKYDRLMPDLYKKTDIEDKIVLDYLFYERN